MIRLFVGVSPNHDDIESQAVLEWSIRKHASLPVEITWMKLNHDPASPWHGWRTELWATPFSGFRWAIPSVCDYQGRAIYTDSDVIVMADIAELWNQPMQPGKVALAKGGGSWRYCVSLWDCLAAALYVPPVNQLKAEPRIHQRMTEYFAAHPQLTQAFQGDWNCLDGEGHRNLKEGTLKALHYTDMSSQPHLKYATRRLHAEGRKHWFNGKVRAHPRPDVQALFDELLEEARANGYPPERYAADPLYGDFRKRSLTDYRGRAVA